MIILILFAFLAGLVTILSPCILPVLPIILSSGISKPGTKPSLARPLGIVFGFILSFTFFTLFLSTIVKILGIPSDSLRIFAIVVIAFFGVSMIIPALQTLTEKIFTKISRLSPTTSTKPSFWSGILLGITLGLLWTPCVGPILASVISLAISGAVTFNTFLITLAYSIGTAIPMLIIINGGSQLVHKVPWLLTNAEKIQKVFGVIMILTAIALYLNLDLRFQAYITSRFPSYGAGLTQIENNPTVQKLLSVGNSTGTGQPAPEIVAGGQWFNSNPLTIQSLKGKVVLVDFWTYTCINCIRTLPYLNDWYNKYSSMGFVIIGVHSPEFEFEKIASNVSMAIKDFNIKYPVVQDNNLATWNAFNNSYWPADYLIDKNGTIRFTHFGEGDYSTTEQQIQSLLAEVNGQKPNVSINTNTYSIDALTPETYLGYGRGDTSSFTMTDNIQSFKFPSSLSRDQVAFSGNWYLGSEYLEAQPGASLEIDFNAKYVYLVMKPKDKSQKINVFVDGIQQDFGKDNQNGTVIIDTDRLYHLITLPQAEHHLLRIDFPAGGVQAYAFTFG